MDRRPSDKKENDQQQRAYPAKIRKRTSETARSFMISAETETHNIFHYIYLSASTLEKKATEN